MPEFNATSIILLVIAFFCIEIAILMKFHSAKRPPRGLEYIPIQRFFTENEQKIYSCLSDCCPEAYYLIPKAPIQCFISSSNKEKEALRFDFVLCDKQSGKPKTVLTYIDKTKVLSPQYEKESQIKNICNAAKLKTMRVEYPFRASEIQEAIKGL